MYVVNEPVMKKNEAVLNYLLGDLYTIETNDKIPDNYKDLATLIQATQNEKQGITGLAKLLKLKIGAKVILTFNLDIQDYLINSDENRAHSNLQKIYLLHHTLEAS